ncbi:MAG: hypothetical protein IAF58_16905 [Leptolyngbya sp.]|nr:hypothetical protein [Candidatus Melainabacteria bacterium]
MANDADGQFEPKKQLELSGSSGDGNNPRPRVLTGQEEPDGPRYARGQRLKCRVIGFREGGYQVLLIRDGITGFLKSDVFRDLGDELWAEFDCWRDRPPL